MLAKSFIQLVKHYTRAHKEVTTVRDNSFTIAHEFMGFHPTAGKQRVCLFRERGLFTEAEKDILETVVEDGQVFAAKPRKQGKKPEPNSFTINFYTHCSSMGSSPYANNLLAVGGFAEAATLQTIFDVDWQIAACSFGLQGFNTPQVPTCESSGEAALQHFNGLKSVVQKAMQIGEQAVRAALTDAQFEATALANPAARTRTPSSPMRKSAGTSLIITGDEDRGVCAVAQIPSHSSNIPNIPAPTCTPTLPRTSAIPGPANDCSVVCLTGNEQPEAARSLPS